MGSSVAVSLWRDVVGKRWVGCAVWQAVTSTVLWLLSEMVLNRVSRTFTAQAAQGFLPFFWTGLRFALFEASQGFFLLGQTFVVEPEEREAASLGDLASGLARIAARAVVGRPRDDSAKGGLSEIRSKILTSSDYVLFATMCAGSGFLAFLSLLSWAQVSSGSPSLLEAGSRGAALGLVYAALQFYRGTLALAFPLVERGLFFALKMGVPAAVSDSFTLAAVLVPLGEAVSFAVLSSASTGVEPRGASPFSRQALYAVGSFAVLLSWELGRHIVQVLQTKQHVFAPPLGSAAAEVDSTDLLLTVLEDPETSTLVRYHAFHDLCVVSETNVDTWRRAAFFEETGDTYKRLVTACLKRLDMLTFGLAQHLEGFQAGDGAEFFQQQMQSVQADRPLAVRAGHLKSQFRDFQLCAWCARTVAALTACSRFEDRYGVAQLHGCNVDVVSSLLSCLLVVEVYLGRRSHSSGAGFVPNSIKWTVPSRGAFMTEATGGKRQASPFGKRSVLHGKAYAMADVLRTSIYHIVSVFGDEMVQSGSSVAGFSIAERDWLSRKKPLFGAPEIHLQKLKMFVEFCVG